MQILSILIYFSCVSFAYLTDHNDLNRTSTRWSNVIKFINKTTWSRQDKYLNALKLIIENGKSKLSVNCLDSLIALKNGFIKQSDWASRSKFYKF